MAESIEARSLSVKVRVSPDEMTAYLIVEPGPEGTVEVGYEQVLELVAQSGVVHGVDLPKIREALSPESWGRLVLIAQGTPPVNGQDGRVEYKFSIAERTGPAETADGRVDYRNLNLIQNVQKGQLLAVKLDPTPGTPGMTVTGKPVPAKPGKAAIIRRGRNTVLDETGHNLYSTIDGHVRVVEDKIAVEPVYEVGGDVDFASGNIDFVGDVVIRGAVTSGFKVRAGGNVEIYGVVEAATVEAGGNILVRQGIAGADRALVQAQGSVMARYIENARVIAGQDVVATDSIIQARVSAGRTVRAEGKKGAIVGGHVQARDEISARVIGSSLATQTVLEVGTDPLLREEYRVLAKEYREKKKSLETMAQNLQVLQKGLLAENLSDKRRLALLKMLQDYKALAAEVRQMEERYKALEEEFNRSQHGRIKVFDVVYPGVHVCMGKAMYTVNDPIKNAMFVLESGDIRLTSAL